MRLALIAALLAGCYKPSAEDACRVLCPMGECPEGAQCTAGRCVPNGGTCATPADGTIDTFVPVIDGFVSPDAAADAPGTMTCAPSITTVVGAYSNRGSSFTMNRSRTRAAMLTHDTMTDNDVISVADGAGVDMIGAVFVEKIQPTALIASLAFPRLAPDGNTIFMMAKNQEATYIAFSNHNAVNGQWSSPVAIELQDGNGLPLGVLGTVIPGAPSEASPRRMPITLGTTTGFAEFEEIAQNTWRQRATTTGASLGGLVLVREPSFTPDGLRVVFIGQVSTGNVGIWSASRTTLGSPWGALVQVFDDGTSSEASPFLASDCGKLFYDDVNTTRVLVAQ